jgi:hypothetical protein
MSAVELALAFAAAQLPVFPVKVHWDQARQVWRKKSLVEDDWQRRATTNPDRIKASWDYWARRLATDPAVDLQILPGLPLGRCGLVVIDADRHPGSIDGVAALHELGELPPHPVVVTKSGGEHHFFRQPETPIDCAEWKGGELLGRTKFVVGYAVPQGDIPVLPEAWLRHTTHMGTAVQVNGGAKAGGEAVVPIVCASTKPPTEYQRNYAWQSLGNAWNELRKCPPGSRNSKLNGLAYSLGRQVARNWVAREQVEFWLLRACQENGLLGEDGIEQCQATLRSGISAGALRPYHDIGSERSEDGS